MRVQPAEHGTTSPTQMLPALPTSKGEPHEEEPAQTGSATPDQPAQSRTEAVRVARAKIIRRKSLRKQRDAQRS